MATVKMKMTVEEAAAFRGMMKLVDGQKRVEQGSNKLAKTGKKVKKVFGSMLLKYAGAAALIAAAGKLMTSEMKNAAEAADKLGKSLAATRDLVFLGEFAKAHPELQKEIGAFAVQAGLPGEAGRVEIAKAWELVVSKTANMNEKQRMEMMRQGVELRRTTTTDLSTLMNLFIQIRKADPGATSTAIANLIQQTKTEAGASTVQMAARLPQILGVGQAAGLDVAQTSALFAIATSRFPAEKATTGLRMMMGRLQGKELPKEARKVQKRLGLEKGMEIFEQLEVLSGAFEKGTFKLAEAQLLFGEEAGPIAIAVISDFKDLVTSYGRIKEAYQKVGLDLVAEKLGEVAPPGSVRALEEDVRRGQARRVQVQIDKDARRGLEVQRRRDETYIRERQRGRGHLGAEIGARVGDVFDWIVGIGPYRGELGGGLGRSLSPFKRVEQGIDGGGGGMGEKLEANTKAMEANTDELKKKNGNGNGNGLRVRVNANVEQ